MLPLETRSLLTRLATHLSDSDLDAAWEMYLERTEETNSLPNTADFMRFLLDQGQISNTQYNQLSEVISENSVVLDTKQLLELTQAETISQELLIQVPELDQTQADPTLLNDDQTITLMDILPAQTDHSVKQNLLVTESERYDLLETLGRGAMGEVLLAKDQFLHRQVAYKQILSDMSISRAAASRFVKEAQITSQLSHPNIIPIYHLEVSVDGKIAYSMKLIRGKDLKQVLAEIRQHYQSKQSKQAPNPDYSLDRLLEHFLKVCEALHYAHLKGVIHRDLKPANIMIGPYGEIYVMDWGIARLISDHQNKQASTPDQQALAELLKDMPDPDQTQMGQILGTPRYMSPQQAAGKNNQLDGRSDQFALGLILFEMVTLKPAFTAREPIELLKQVLKAEKQSLTHLYGAKIPDELKAIIHKATARKPEDRYDDLAAFAEDLRRFCRGEAVLARPDNLWQQTTRWMSLHQRASLLIFMTGFLLCASAVGLSLWREQSLLAENIRHEQTLQNLTTELAGLGQQLDTRLIRFEGLLNALADVAITALDGSLKTDKQYYLHNQFHPPDLAYSSHYHKAISLNWPVFKLAPGLTESQARPQLEQLSPLRQDFRQIFLKSSVTGKLPLDPQSQRHLIAEVGVPLVWGYIGLENGLMYAYPGKSTYPEHYDPRQRPWYQAALQHTGLNWGKPYLDLQGQGLLLPITRTLYSHQGKLLGVAGLEIPLSSLSALLQLPKQNSLKGLYLLDTQGQLLTQSPQAAPPNPAHLAQVMTSSSKSSGSGYFETAEEFIAYTRLENLEVILVAALDRKTLFRPNFNLKELNPKELES